MYPDPYNEAHQSEVYREFSFGGDPERDISRMNELEMEADTKSSAESSAESSTESDNIDNDQA